MKRTRVILTLSLLLNAILLGALAYREVNYRIKREWSRGHSAATDRPSGTVLVIPTRLGAQPAVEC